MCNVSGKAGAWHSHLVMVAWNMSLIQVHVLWQSVWEGFELFLALNADFPGSLH